MRRRIVAGNWKMHGTRVSIGNLLQGILAGFEANESSAGGIDVQVFPPSVYLELVCDTLHGRGLGVGAQNIHPAEEGAFTGEISASMVRDVGASHVLVGHSERRHLFAETDAVVAAKFVAAQAAGLIPILCLGETRAEREAGTAESVVAQQLDAVVSVAGIGALGGAILAYEPVWAIGTGLTASPEDAQSMHAALRCRIGETDKEVANALQILYGGSVNRENAAALFDCADIDGGLIGGASLDPDAFLAVCAAAGSAAGG